MSESPAMIRAFIAVSPSPEILARLEQLQRSLKYPLARAGITWAKPGQTHLTLKFLGDIATDSVDELRVAIESAVKPGTAFSLRAGGLGVFPDDRKPRVIWVGVDGELEALGRLQERIEQATTRWRETERRAFHPHLTLGRVRHLTAGQSLVLREKLAELRAADFGEWRVERVELTRSILTADGAVYSRMAGFRLG